MDGVRIWTDRLSGLLPRLKREAEKTPGRWAHRGLRGGALVACRLRNDLGYDVRIARETKPATEDGWRRWRVEVGTFRRELGIEGWRVRDDPDAAGVAVILSEPVPPRQPGEVLPGDLFGEAPAAPRPPSAIEQGR